MTLYYIGDNDNEYGFKYGDEIDLTSSANNIENSDIFGINLYHCKKDKNFIIYSDLAYIIDNFTLCEYDLLEEKKPKKPYEEYGYMICPNCGEIVTDDFSECENCGHALDWEDKQ